VLNLKNIRLCASGAQESEKKKSGWDWNCKSAHQAHRLCFYAMDRGGLYVNLI